MGGRTNTYLKVWLGAAKPFADVSEQVISVEIKDEDRGTDIATVTIGDQAHVNASAIREGTEVRIEMGWESEHALLFIGVIQKVEATASAAGATTSQLSFTVYDFSVRMQVQPVGKDAKHAGTLEDVLKTIVGRSKIPIGQIVVGATKTWTEADPLFQGTRTDWQLIQDLANDYRARAFVEVNSDPTDKPADVAAGGVARFYFLSEESILAAKPSGTMHYCRGSGPLIEFTFTRIGQGASPTATVVTMDQKTGGVVTQKGEPHAPDAPAALSPTTAEGIKAAYGSGKVEAANRSIDHTNAQPDKPVTTRPVVTEGGKPSDPASAATDIEKDQTRLLGLFGRGLAMGSVQLRAKGSLEIIGLANDASGIWYLKKVMHVFEKAGSQSTTQNTFRSRFEVTR